MSFLNLEQIHIVSTNKLRYSMDMNLLSPAGIVAILIALSVHEWAHAYAAYKLGDPTAKNEGRLTLNPISHLDPLGTLLFVIVGFGWGKPVPIDPRYFKNEKRDTAIVAAAGPASNIVLAVIALIILALTGTDLPSSIYGLLSNNVAPTTLNGVLLQICALSVVINILLMAFNLLPIAPLDGSKIVRLFVPYQHEQSYEQFMMRGPTILLLILIIDNFVGIPILSGWINIIMQPTYTALAAMVTSVL